MTKAPTLTDITNIDNAASILNANWDAIQEAFENTLSRDGSTPNQMEADLDMNSNDILNAKDISVTGTLTVSGQDINDLLSGLGSGEVYNITNRFDGDGSTVLFTLTTSPISRANTQVYVDGIYQQKNTYTISGTALTFSEAPPVGTENIEVNLQTPTTATGFGTAAMLDVPASGDAAVGEVVKGDDTRLTDARTPTSHTHTKSEITDLLPVYYSSRAAFVSGEGTPTWTVGALVGAGGFFYEYDGTSTDISDLAGWKPFGDVFPEHFGAVGDGSSNDTTKIQAALDHEGRIKLKEGATYLISSAITLTSGDTIFGEGSRRATIKLANTSNVDVISGNTVSNITLQNFIIDGNKANQSTVTASGIYLLNTCSNIHISGVEIRDTYGHGLQFSGGSLNEGNLIENCRAIGVGATANTTEGTGFTGGSEGTKWVNCYANDCGLNGYKAGGIFVNCTAENGRSGGFETGATGTDYNFTRYIGCTSKNNNGDGFRNLGLGDRLSYINCLIEGNGASGITFVNDVDSAIVDGCWIRNNGQRYAEAGRSSTAGYDGIFISKTSIDPTNITITNTRFSNEANTQEYHIFVNAAVQDFVLSDTCVFEGAARNANLWFGTGNSGLTTFVGRVSGHPAVVRDIVSASTSSIVGETLKTTTIPAQTLYPDQPIKVVAMGTCSGTAGTKTIRFRVGATSIIVNDQLAAGVADWGFEATLYRDSGSTVMALIKTFEDGTSGVLKTISITNAFTSDLTFYTTGVVGNAADTITQSIWLVEPA